MNSNKNIETLSKLRNFICHHSDFSKALTAIDECMQMSYMDNRPIGSLLLGAGGVAAYGNYGGDSFWKGWAPVPRNRPE